MNSKDTDEIAKIIKESTGETGIGDAIEPTNLANDLADYFEEESKKPKGTHKGEGTFSNITYCDNCHYQVKPKDMCECAFNREEFLKKAGVNE